MRKLFLSCLLAVGLSFVAPLSASVPGLERTAVSASEAQTPDAGSADAESPASSGWQQNSKGWYYLKNGARLKGWQNIDGNRYYFNTSGYRVSGSRKIDGKYYLFRPAAETENPGALCRNKKGLISFKSDPDTFYYLKAGKKGLLTVNKWVKSDGGYYYANAKGKIKLGTIKVNGKLYHITANGRMTFYGKSSYDNQFYYAGMDGVLKTGFQTIGGKRYYFSQDGKRVSGVTKIGNYKYCFRDNGILRTGWVKKSNGKKVYYYDQAGHRVSGWYTIKGKKYYFDPKKDDLRVQNCWKKINGKYYYFNASGVMQTGFFTVNGKRYYTNVNGVRQKGWKKINGRKYYIDPKTFVVKTGWLKQNGKTYYLNPKETAASYSAAVTGWAQIPTKNGKKKYWHYFRSDGTMYTGWLTENGKRYYLNPSNGRMFTGKHKIDGKEYTFAQNGVYTFTPTGPWRIEVNRRSCFIVVYRGDTPVRAFVCSTAADGKSTPTGTFTLLDKLRWHELKGPSWGQYCSHITADILFHSVPNFKYQDNHSLETAEYNKLGQPASAGCIRLTVKHAKYLYDNCPIGTKVVISDYITKPAGITIETAPKIPSWQNYDPTDPNA